MVIATSSFGEWKQTGHSNDGGRSQPVRSAPSHSSGGSSGYRPSYSAPTTRSPSVSRSYPSHSSSVRSSASDCRPSYRPQARSYSDSHCRPSYQPPTRIHHGSSFSLGYSSGYRPSYSLSYRSSGYGISYQIGYYDSGVSIVNPPVSYYPSQEYVPVSDYYPQTNYEQPAVVYIQQPAPQQQVIVQQQVPQQQVIVEREAPQQQVFVQQEAPQQGQVSQEVPTNPSEGYVQQQNEGPTITIKPVQNVEVTPNAVYHLRLSSGKVVSFSIDVGQ